MMRQDPGDCPDCRTLTAALKRRMRVLNNALGALSANQAEAQDDLLAADMPGRPDAALVDLLWNLIDEHPSFTLPDLRAALLERGLARP